METKYRNNFKKSNIFSKRMVLFRNERLGVTTQTLFMILMVIIMVGIVIFGYLLFLIFQDPLTEAEKLEVREEITEAMKFCRDPLNSGNVRSIDFEHDEFNSFCVLGENYEDDEREDWTSVRRGGDNVILLKTVMQEEESGEESHVLSDYQIRDSFSLGFNVSFNETNPEEDHYCWYDLDNSGRLEDKVIECD